MTDLEKKLNEHGPATIGNHSGIEFVGRPSESQKITMENRSKDLENSSVKLFEEEKKKQIKLRKPYKAPGNKLKPIPQAKPLRQIPKAKQLKKI